MQDLNGNARFEHTALWVLVFDQTTEDFDLELVRVFINLIYFHIYIDTSISCYWGMLTQQFLTSK